MLIQLLNRLEKLHSAGVIHGNVCPEALRLDFSKNLKLTLCDFYYSRRLPEDESESKRDCRRTRFEGSAFFSSDAACRQNDMSIYDDLESTLIVASYLLNG